MFCFALSFLFCVVIESIASWDFIAALRQTFFVRIFWRQCIPVNLVLCALSMLRVVVVAFVASTFASAIRLCYKTLVVLILKTQMAATNTFADFVVHNSCKYCIWLPVPIAWTLGGWESKLVVRKMMCAQAYAWQTSAFIHSRFNVIFFQMQ